MLAAFLVACGTTQTPVTVIEKSDLPDVPRASRPSAPSCTVAGAGLLADLRTMRDNTPVNPTRLAARLKTNLNAKVAGDPGYAVLPNTLQSVLYSTKALLNTYYFGFSQVNLDQVHKTYEEKFRQGRPLNFSAYKLEPVNNDAIDLLMREYLRAVQDSHTFYLRPSSYGSQQAVSGGGSGPVPDFGILDLVATQSGGALLLDVQAGSPALNAGLRRGDTLLEVDGQILTLKVDAASTYQGYYKILFDAAAKPQAVTLKYSRAGIPASVQIKGEVLPAGALPWGEVINNANGSFYYLRIPSFLTPSMANEVHALVKAAKATTVKGVIVDLRDNPGGSLIELVGAVAAFSSTNAVQKLETIDANDLTFRFVAGKVTFNDACNSDSGSVAILNPDEWTGKVAILETGYSASASEFFAQMLRLGGKATIIGEETAGVGNTFTYTVPISSGRAISVTAGRVRNRNGAYFTETVKPDIAQPDDLAQLLQGNDLAMNAAIQTLK
jgi:carboxyl-terminal processing protease